LKIIGVDPGIAESGVGAIEQQSNSLSLIEYYCISTSPDTPFPERLVAIYNGFMESLEKIRPDACAIESIFFAKNAKSAFQVGHARGVFIVCAANAGVPVYEYTPPQIKKALVGKGRAEKGQVQYMTKMVLGLDEIPRPDHCADAIAVAICHSNASKFDALTGGGRQVFGRRKR